MSSQFTSFRELLLHCLKCHESGDSAKALALIDDYLSGSQASTPPSQFYSTYNIQQALGFRVAFMEKTEPGEVAEAEARHLSFCREQLHYWLSAAADSSARLALSRFHAGEMVGGHRAAQEATKFAGALGLISATVAQATEEARKHTTP